MIASLARNLFLASAAFIGAAVAVFVIGDKAWTPPAARAVDPSLFVPVPVPEFSAGSVELTEIAARPLFNASRRPPPPPPPVAAEQPPEADPFANVKVLGLFGSGGEGGAILLIDGKVKRVRFGEEVGPWVLRGVRGRVADFSRAGGVQSELKMVHLPQTDAPPEPPGGAKGEAPSVGGAPQPSAASSAEARIARLRAQAAARAQPQPQPQPQPQ